MSLLSKLIDKVHSWRRRRGESKTRRGADLRIEQLDHRQLLAVTFTGNVRADFPLTNTTGIVNIEDTGNLTPPVVYANLGNNVTVLPGLQSTIQVTGLDISGFRVSYDPTLDTLYVGVVQPLNPRLGTTGRDGSGNPIGYPIGSPILNSFTPLEFPVIAGDDTNSGNNAVVDPAIASLPNGATLTQGFQSALPFLSKGDASLYAFIDLSGTGNPSQYIAAGIDSTPVATGKHYIVANGVFGNGLPVEPPSLAPSFGPELTGNEGPFFVGTNDPAHGAMELGISHFSQLYDQVTGHVLTPQSIIRIGGQGASATDAISEATFPLQPVTIANASPPVTPNPPPVICPPLSPPVLINPHAFDHINTAHNDLVRVTVYGSSGFDPRLIVPSTVRLGGATPVSEFSRSIPYYQYPAETFVFHGLDIHLPPGVTEAAVTGTTSDGTNFSSAQLVFNRDDSFYTQSQILNRNTRLGITTTLPTTHNVLSGSLIQTGLRQSQLQAQADVLAQQYFAAEVANGTFNATTNPASSLSSLQSLFLNYLEGQPTTVTAAAVTAAAPAFAVAPSPVALTQPLIPATVSIPTAATHAAGATRTRHTPTMKAAHTFVNSRVSPTIPKAPTAAQALAAQDAAMASLATQNSVPQTAG